MQPEIDYVPCRMGEWGVVSLDQNNHVVPVTCRAHGQALCVNKDRSNNHWCVYHTNLILHPKLGRCILVTLLPTYFSFFVSLAEHPKTGIPNHSRSLTSS